MTATPTSPAVPPRRARWLWFLPLAALAIPAVTNDYTQFVINLMLVYIPVAVGFNVVIGNLGQLAFANAAFFGLGAYTTGVLMVHLGLPFWLAVPPAAVTGALAGVLASVAALRNIRLYYLAIVTLAFGELMRWVYIQATPLTGGSLGMSLPRPEILGLSLSDDKAKFYVILPVVTLLVVATRNLLSSRVGRAIVAIKENELAAASLGIPTARYFVIAFAWSGFVVGLGGGLFAILLGHIDPASFDLVELIRHFALVMFGGVGTLAGSVLGALTLTAAPEFFRGFPGLEELFFALLIIVVLVFLPRGLVSLLTPVIPALRERFYRE